MINDYLKENDATVYELFMNSYAWYLTQIEEKGTEAELEIDIAKYLNYNIVPIYVPSFIRRNIRIDELKSIS